MILLGRLLMADVFSISKYANKNNIWDKVFKNGPNEVCERQHLKHLNDMVCLSRPYHFKFFKDCLPQVLFALFLNTLSHI